MFMRFFIQLFSECRKTFNVSCAFTPRLDESKIWCNPTWNVNVCQVLTCSLTLLGPANWNSLATIDTYLLWIKNLKKGQSRTSCVIDKCVIRRTPCASSSMWRRYLPRPLKHRRTGAKWNSYVGGCHFCPKKFTLGIVAGGEGKGRRQNNKNNHS
jgi:hypothetical protein